MASSLRRRLCIPEYMTSNRCWSGKRALPTSRKCRLALGSVMGIPFTPAQPSLIATVPIGYGDGLSRRLSNNLALVVGGMHCPQVGQICMDQSLVDVTALRGRVKVGDEAVIVGQQGQAAVTVDELADKLGVINYEVVTSIATRVPRIAIGPFHLPTPCADV